PVSGSVGIETGPFFDGDRLEFDATLAWRPSAHCNFAVEYERNEVDLAAGTFTTNLGRVRVNLFFSPDLAWQNFVQYDNDSRVVGLNSRFRWTIEPGRDLFLDFTETAIGGGGSLVPQQQVLAGKIGYTFRF
ncbi:MAG TPA: hypothetical protein VK348_09065, partial [Planctomycetota bacterium]|nr:hypothetical protein [Planctomycetota bacterium]